MAGCSPKKAIQIDHRVTRNIDRWPHGVVSLLAVRDHDIQTVGRASLKDDHQPLVAGTGLDGREAARVRKVGTAAVPTTASAPLRRNILRVMDIKP